MIVFDSIGFLLFEFRWYFGEDVGLFEEVDENEPLSDARLITFKYCVGFSNAIRIRIYETFMNTTYNRLTTGSIRMLIIQACVILVTLIDMGGNISIINFNRVTAIELTH